MADEDAHTCSVPNTVHDYSEGHSEVIQPNLEGTTSQLPTSKAITLCHIDELKGLQSGIRFIIEDDNILKPLDEAYELAEVPDHVIDGSQKEIIIQSVDEQTEQYFLFGGEVHTDALDSLTEQDLASNAKDELLHNQLNIHVYNTDVLYNDIPCESEIVLESNGREECKKESESVRLTADILSTSLAIVANDRHSKDENLNNPGVDHTPSSHVNIPKSIASPFSAQPLISRLDSSDIAETSDTGASYHDYSHFDNFLQNKTTDLFSGDPPIVSQMPIPSNSQTALTSSKILVEQGKSTDNQPDNANCDLAVKRNSVDPTTGIELDQLSRPPEDNMGKSLLNHDELQMVISNKEGHPPQICTGELSATRKENLQPPDISQLHIEEPESQANLQVNYKFGSNARPKVKKKSKCDPPKEKLLNSVKKSAGIVKRPKRSNSSMKQKDNASKGMKRYLGKWIAAKQARGMHPEMTSVAQSSKAKRLDMVSPSSSSSCVAVIAMALQASVEPIADESGAPDIITVARNIADDESSSQNQQGIAPTVDIAKQQQEVLNVTNEMGDVNSGETFSETATICEEMIPTVVEEIEKVVDEPPKKRKTFKKFKKSKWE